MSYLKKEITEEVIRHYTNEAWELIFKINRNKQEINKLAKEQAVLKKRRRTMFAFLSGLRKGLKK